MKRCLLLLIFLVTASYSKAGDTTLVFYHHGFKAEVQVKYPKVPAKGTILLLHGYNLPPMQWCEKTSLCQKALAKGYVLIIPDFGKTTYQEKVYPQTVAAFRTYPTRKWIRDTVITALQEKLKLLLPGTANFVLGLSTGARGAALLSVDLPQVFKAAGCLSGDYDQTQLPAEKIYTLYYGDYKKYSAIWKNDDNLHALIRVWQMPVYLAHGDHDKICPVSQTINFYHLLVKTHPQLKVVYNIAKNQQHDYTFWGSQTDGVLRFFDGFC
jgi:pimeloyl-ACP methyl ester carboxylesterase